MSETIYVLDGKAVSAALRIYLLTREDLTVLEEVPPTEKHPEFVSVSIFKDDNGRRFWPVSLTPAHKPPHLAQQGKPVAQWKQERKGWRK